MTPKQYRRSYNYRPIKYKYSLKELKNKFSKKTMLLAAEEYRKIEEVNNKINGNQRLDQSLLTNHPNGSKMINLEYLSIGVLSLSPDSHPQKEKGTMYHDWYEYRMYTDTAFMKYNKRIGEWIDKG